MAKTATRGVELEPIDRLEDKVKRWWRWSIGMKAEQARAAEENQRLPGTRSLRARVAASETLAIEMSTLQATSAT